VIVSVLADSPFGSIRHSSAMLRRPGKFDLVIVNTRRVFSSQT
jgi:hypothetical protein